MKKSTIKLMTKAIRKGWEKAADSARSDGQHPDMIDAYIEQVVINLSADLFAAGKIKDDTKFRNSCKPKSKLVVEKVN